MKLNARWTVSIFVVLLRFNACAQEHVTDYRDVTLVCGLDACSIETYKYRERIPWLNHISTKNFNQDGGTLVARRIGSKSSLW